MGWKREQFKRRMRELAAECDSTVRAYVPLQEVENDNAYSVDYTWQCLSKAWVAGRAMGKSPLTLQDEAEKWLAEIEVRQPRVISQAFIDAKLWHRVWNNKCEMSRLEMVKKMLNVSERGAKQGHDELRAWYSDIVAEFANIYKTRSLPDSNYAIGGWAETEGILPRLWSLYANGAMTTEDRSTLKALVIEITNASDRQAEAWISAEERMKECSVEHQRERTPNR